MTQNLNYYWQKRNEQEQKARESEEVWKSVNDSKEKFATNEKMAALEAENEELKQQVARARRNANTTEDYYKDLLTKDFHEIAKVSGGTFLENYHEQQTILGNWMVSQKAFKELAIKYGLESERSKEEIIAEGMATKSKVLDNQTEHDNNFDRNDWEIFYAPRIKAKYNIK